jgi:hypothetical protein
VLQSPGSWPWGSPSKALVTPRAMTGHQAPVVPGGYAGGLQHGDMDIGHHAPAVRARPDRIARAGCRHARVRSAAMVSHRCRGVLPLEEVIQRELDHHAIPQTRARHARARRSSSSRFPPPCCADAALPASGAPLGTRG